MQTAYQIVVAGQAGTVWDSGVVSSDRSILIPYAGAPLLPTTAYSVALSVWDNHGAQHAGTAAFETGLLSPEHWRGRWITHSLPAEETACPVFRKTLQTAGKPIRAARIYATAYGVYEITVNGRKVGDAFLAPGWTSYRNRLQYQTYDITALAAGAAQLRVEISVGNGWYKGYLNGEGESCFYGDRTAALAMLRLEYADGETVCVGTDESWTVTTGVVESAELYHGETQNFTEKAAPETPALPFDASGMNSLNHDSYGAIGDWLYQKVAGIVPAAPGYQRIRLQPALTHGMTEASASLETMYGTVRCGWKCRNGKITVEAEIPPNTTAVLVLPEQDGERSLGSGTYRFEYPTATVLETGAFSESSTFGEILADARASQILYAVMPEMKDSPALGYLRDKTIAEMAALSAGSAPALRELAARLRGIGKERQAAGR